MGNPGEFPSFRSIAPLRRSAHVLLANPAVPPLPVRVLLWEWARHRAMTNRFCRFRRAARWGKVPAFYILPILCAGVYLAVCRDWATSPGMQTVYERCPGLFCKWVVRDPRHSRRLVPLWSIEVIPPLGISKLFPNQIPSFDFANIFQLR